MASYDIGNITEDSFTVYVNGFTSDLTRYMQIRVNSTEWFNDTLINWLYDYQGQMEVTGLDSGTSYVVAFYIGSSQNWYENTRYERLEVTTEGGDELLPFEVYNIDASLDLDGYGVSSNYASLTISVTFYNPNNERYSENVYIWARAYYNDGTNFTASEQEKTLTISAYGTKTFTYTYDWYISKNQFPVTFRVYGESELGYRDYDDFEFDLSNLRPDYFYWINSSTRLNDSSHKGKPISDYITASKWKALQNNVNEVRVYKGLGNYSFSTNIVSGVTPITAALYNEVANAINAMKSGTVSKVTKGVTPITTSVMMSLQDGINSIT